MSDDWRVRIEFQEGDHAGTLTDMLEASGVQRDLEHSLRDRVVVSRDGSEVFGYTQTLQDAREVERLVRELADQQGWRLETECKRWHAASEQWEDPGAPLDSSAEHAALMAEEREEAERRGYPEFEVRVDCRSHAQAAELAERLAAEGIESVRRSQYVLIGAVDEDEAAQLADRLNHELPGAHAAVEGTLRAVAAGVPGHPFAIFGGMGG